MPMKRRNADIESMFGLSTNGVKLYEKQNIIHPTRQSGNQYRVYGFDDLQALGYASQFRRCGFSMQETADLINEKSEMEHLDALSQQADLLEEEIEALRRKRKTLLENARLGKAALSLTDRCRMGRSPSLYFLGLRRGEEYLTPQSPEKMGVWMTAYSPHTLSAILFDGPYLIQPDYDRAPQYGVAVPAAAALELGPRLSPEVTLTHPKPCVETAFQIDYDKPGFSSVLERVRLFAAENSLLLQGGGIALITSCLRRNGRLRCTCLFWAPLRESESQYGVLR